MRLVGLNHPTAFLLAKSARLATYGKGTCLHDVKRLLAALGYRGIVARGLSKEVGQPHNRRRTDLIWGVADDRNVRLEPPPP